MTFIKGGVFELGYIQCDTTYVLRGNPKVNINNVGGDPSWLGLALKGKTTQKTTTCMHYELAVVIQDMFNESLSHRVNFQ